MIVSVLVPALTKATAEAPSTMAEEIVIGPPFAWTYNPLTPEVILPPEMEAPEVAFTRIPPLVNVAVPEERLRLLPVSIRSELVVLSPLPLTAAVIAVLVVAPQLA